jgi:ATP-dependent DNA helicase RecG
MLSAMTGEMSRAEIMAELGLRDEKHFRENYQQYGINQGLIGMTLPDTPRSRKQRYRLTARGKELRARTKRQG